MLNLSMNSDGEQMVRIHNTEEVKVCVLIKGKDLRYISHMGWTDSVGKLSKTGYD